MRIAYIAAGAAGMYCGTCMHDNALAAALLGRGHQVTLVPTYTPLRTDEPDVSGRRIFYGALNVYLQQKSALFRHTPAFLDRLLDSRLLLNQLSRFGAATDAHDLGALTLSVLRGERGHQAKELAKLVDWLAELRPEVVQLTNSMFLGFTRSIKARLGPEVAVVCGLTGEDVFLDELVPPWHDQVRRELVQRAADADGFIATSRYYAGAMTRALAVEAGRMHVVPLGITLDDLPTAPPILGSDGDRRDPERPFTVGYLARVCPEKGLDRLLDGFRLLAERRGHERVRLRVAGYVGPRDRGYLEEQRRRVAEWGLEGSVDFLGEVDREGKRAFLSSLDALSVPTVYQEPKGLYVLEALAFGVPVVQPRHGAFPELLAATGGGLLVEPGDAAELADALAKLAADPALARQLGRQGHAAVHQRFDAATMAANTEAVYQRILAQPRAGGGAID